MSELALKPQLLLAGKQRERKNGTVRKAKAKKQKNKQKKTSNVSSQLYQKKKKKKEEVRERIRYIESEERKGKIYKPLRKRPKEGNKA